MLLTRRRVLIGLLAAPIVVRPGLLMPVKPLVIVPPGLTVSWYERPIMGGSWARRVLAFASPEGNIVYVSPAPGHVIDGMVQVESAAGARNNRYFIDSGEAPSIMWPV